MIVEGQLLLPDTAGRGVLLRPGQLLIEGGSIAGVGSAGQFGTADLGHERALVTPGFIDAHAHLPQFDCIGIDGLTLLDWLNAAVFPTEMRWADPEFARDAAARAARRMLAAGTTGVCAYATVHHAGAQRAIDALGGMGMRGCVGQVLMDQQAPDALLRPANQLVREAASLEGCDRISPSVTPRFAVSCSDALLRSAGELARSTGWTIQTHLSEMVGECELATELHGAETYTEIYQRAGLLTDRTILAHGIHLSPAERAQIAGAGAIVAHCPTANLFLQAGQMDLAGHVSAGMRVALGSDVAGGPDPCMVRVARAMIETAKSRRMIDGVTPVPTPSAAWRQITLGNALALGWRDAGRLEVGAAADVLVIDPTVGASEGFAQPRWMEASDPLSLVMYGWDERWIVGRIAGGRVVDQA